MLFGGALTFVHVGLAAAGLAAISIPILIHLLFRQRRKPVEWGAMRFLLEAYSKARQRMRLEQWLLLAVRCLMLALLGAALARPLLSASALPIAQGGRVVYLLIDNGLAAGAQDSPDATAAALDRHKERAAAILNALSPSDRVALIALARPAEGLVDPPAMDQAAVARLVAELPLSQAPTDIPAGLSRLRESLDAQPDDPSPIVVYLLSDFLTGAANLSQPLGTTFGDLESRRALTFVASPPAGASLANVQVVSIESLRHVAIAGGAEGASGGGAESELGGLFTVRLRRVGDMRAEAITTVRLSAEPLRASEPAVVRWEKGQSEAKVEFRLDLRGAQPGEIVVAAGIDRDTLALDNQRFHVLDVRDAVRVAVMDRREFGRPGSLEAFPSGAWFRRALDPTGGGAGARLNVEDIDPSTIDRAALRRIDAVVLTRPDLVSDEGWAILGDFVSGGGLLWLVPPEDETVALWTDASSSLKLPWRWGREIVESGAADGADDAGLALADEPPRSDLLGLLRQELPDLSQPVRVFKHLPIVEGLESDSTLLALADGTPWMVAAAPRAATGVAGGGGSGGEGAGLVVYLGSAMNLEWTSLPAKPLMVALVQETIRQGLGLAQRHADLAPGDRTLAGAAGLPGNAAALRSPAGDTWSILRREGEGPALDRPLTSAGAYAVLNEQGEPMARLAVNVEPDAGRTEAQSAMAVADWLAGTGASWMTLDPAQPAAALGREETKGEISLLLLAIVASLALLETLVARWFSHAKRDDLATGGLEASAPVLTSTLNAAGTGGGARP